MAGNCGHHDRCRFRYDLHTQINGTWSPRLAILYQPVEGHTFHLSGSAAYRPPTLLSLIKTSESPRPSPLDSLFPSIDLFDRSGNRRDRLAPEQISSYGPDTKAGTGNIAPASARISSITISPTSSAAASPTALPHSSTIRGSRYLRRRSRIEFLASRWLSGFANYAYEEIGQSFSGTVRRGAPDQKSAPESERNGNGLSGEISYYYVGAATYPIAQSFTLLANIPTTGVTTPGDRVGSYNLLQPACWVPVLATEGGCRLYARRRGGGFGLQRTQ